MCYHHRVEQKLPTPEQIPEENVAAVIAVVDSSFNDPGEIGATFLEPVNHAGGEIRYSSPDGQAKGGELEARAPGVFLSVKRQWSYDDTLLAPKWVETIVIVADCPTIGRTHIRLVDGKPKLADYRDDTDPSQSVIADDPTPTGFERSLVLLKEVVIEELRKKAAATPTPGPE